MDRRPIVTALLALLLAPALAAAQLPPPSPNRAYLDTTCAPCRDFFQYANGAWLATVQIPPSYTSVGAGREMNDRNQAALQSVLERTAARAARESDPTLRKLGGLYSVLMDSARAEREGLAPIAADLARIAAIRDRAGLLKEFAHASAAGAFTPFRFEPETDPKASRSTIGQLAQGGLGLPERDYYFRTDPKSDTLRHDYTGHVARTLALYGTPPDQATADAQAVFGLETALAESSLSRVQMRDPKALYHKMSVKELGLLAPNVDWPAFFGGAGVNSLADPAAALDVSMPGFFQRLNAELDHTPIETWRAYLRFHELRGAMPWMNRAAFDESFVMNSKLSGQRQPLPRWKRVAQTCDRAMGEALGKAYVEQEFPASSKARMVQLVDNLQAALRERIESRSWMSAATKKQAVTKLNAVLKKIGYPDKWRDYAKLTLDPAQPAVANLRAASAFERQWELSFIGRPADRTLWGMTPPTVNAYYNPLFNEIVFPAGILTPPQFDPRVDDAVNYGSIGMVIGHELTHGFDDEGRQYDADGNLKDWWTDEDSKRFDALAAKVVDQYNGYVAVDTLHLNGKLTLGENIADLGGLTIAYRAWQLSLKGRPAPVIDGWTGPQRFFLGYAQAWRRKLRPESLRTQALPDPHSTAAWRVDGPLSNLAIFREAFGCKDGDPMVRSDTFEIW